MPDAPSVVASLWALSVTIEDGNISDVDKALRAARRRSSRRWSAAASDGNQEADGQLRAGG